MWSWLLSFLSGPLIKGALDAYTIKVKAAGDHDRLTVDLAARELAVQTAEIQTQAQLRIAQVGKWWEPEHLFGYIMVIYVGKVIIWDKVLASWTGGTTDTISGDVGVWAGWIMGAYFAKRGIENVARILKR